MPESFPANPEPQSYEPGDEWRPTEEQRREYEAYLDEWSLPPYTPAELGYDPEAMTDEQRHVLNELNEGVRRRVFLPESPMTIEAMFKPQNRQLYKEKNQEHRDTGDDQAAN